MLRYIGLLCIAAVMGVTLATAGTCGVGLAMGTFTWCGLPFYWIGGFPPAIIVATVFGLPAHLIFRRRGLRSWWHYAVGGLVMAVPVWSDLAQPFDSPRWLQSGFFDSLNYLGSGAAAGFSFWWLAVRREGKNAP
jgi:hypothetical protein